MERAFYCRCYNTAWVTFEVRRKWCYSLVELIQCVLHSANRFTLIRNESKRILLTVFFFCFPLQRYNIFSPKLTPFSNRFSFRAMQSFSSFWWINMLVVAQIVPLGSDAPYPSGPPWRTRGVRYIKAWSWAGEKKSKADSIFLFNVSLTWEKFSCCANLLVRAYCLQLDD